MLVRLLPLVVCLAAAVPTVTAQSDLDELMSRVLARRDDNWRKLQQYTLNERETLQVTALVVMRLYGFEREYHWFPRAGFFVRSPLSADGVTIGEDQRRREEERWLRRAQNRERRSVRQALRDSGADVAGADPADQRFVTASVEDVIRQSFEPDFIKSAQFMRFTFDKGQYALVGREKMLGRDVLRIEYYPTNLFDDDRSRARRPERTAEQKQRRDREEQIEGQMNKVSLVTLWVDPAQHQILRYEFRFQDLDFLPGRSLVRVEDGRATMQMGEPFPQVWLPALVSMRFRMSSAAGPLDAKYELHYDDYKLPTVSGRIR